MAKEGSLFFICPPPPEPRRGRPTRRGYPTARSRSSATTSTGSQRWVGRRSGRRARHSDAGPMDHVALLILVTQLVTVQRFLWPMCLVDIIVIDRMRLPVLWFMWSVRYLGSPKNLCGCRLLLSVAIHL